MEDLDLGFKMRWKIFRMIVVELTGGLGNQLFQYGFGRFLSEQTQGPIRFDLSFYDRQHRLDTPRSFELGLYQTSVEKFNSLQIPGLSGAHIINRALRKINFAGLTEVREREAFSYQNFANLDGRRSYYFRGYWQSYKYLEPVRSLLLRELKPRDRPSDENYASMRTLDSRRCVSIHVRRGDYISNPAAASFHGTCGLEYYNKAITSLLTASPEVEHAFVFSDDLSWCRDNLALPIETTFVAHNVGASSYWDLELMRRANFHIIANSSFSWWGAWLSESSSKVYAPAQWTLSNDQLSNDLIPNDWIRI
jgi:Glycosyl transferase family 11